MNHPIPSIAAGIGRALATLATVAFLTACGSSSSTTTATGRNMKP